MARVPLTSYTDAGALTPDLLLTVPPPPTKRLWGYLKGRSTRVGGCPALLAPDNGWRQQGYAL